MPVSNAIYAAVIFFLKLMLVAICSPLIGCLGLVTIPIRWWQASTGRLKASVAKLTSPARMSAIVGIVVIFIASIGWAATLLAIYENATCSGAGCALGGLGIFLALSLLGCIYGLAELLLSPITFPK